MKYERFEELPVWKSAIRLGVGVYDLTEKPEFQKRYSLRDQIARAAVSVSNNIAEGFERGSNQELLSFLYIARGCAGEVRSILCLLHEIPAFRSLDAESRGLTAQAENISRQSGAWIRALRDSSMKGERYVNQKTRRIDQKTRERHEFLGELQRIRERAAQSKIQDSKSEIQEP